jgi:hypothetical protein
MAQRTSRFAPDVESPEETLRKLGLYIYQNEQIIKSAKPGSPEFEKAKKALVQLRKQFAVANEAVNKQREGEKAAATAKATAKATEELRRAEALGDEEKARIAREKIKKAEEGVTNNAKDSDGDGIPDIKDNLPNVKNPDQKTGTGTTKPKVTTASTAGAKGSGTGAAGAAGAGADTGADNKQIWISFLRKTFAGLEDKTQKDQIDKLFDLAVAQKWDEKTFMEALKGTAWWQNTFPSLRQFFLDTNDPRNKSTFAEKLKNNIDTINDTLEKLGISAQFVDPVTGKVNDNKDFIEGIAMEAIKNNWDDNQIQNYLATKGNILFTGGGTIGSYYNQVKQQAYLYGVTLDKTMQDTINYSLLDPNDGRDINYWLNNVKQMAIDTPEYKPFLESLKAGRNLYEVTNSYRAQMANLLEVDSTAITWKDLMSKVIDNQSGNARTFADFTKQLKQDPLWQYTRNAKETYSNMALDLAKMFGYMG